MSRPPTFSVVLCTRDRAAMLERALGSLAALDYPAADVELLLVDNASQDHTQQVGERFARRAPFAVRVLRETRTGLSAARNRAVREARGTYLFFTDDDQIVDPGVLREHQRVAETYGSRAQQGAIELRFPAGRPLWLHGELAIMLGRTQDVPEGPAAIDLYGGNMLLERALFDGMGAFREDLGKGAAGYSEDLDLTRRLEARGQSIVYAPSARIYHVIEPDRSTPAFFRRNAFAKGWSDGRLHGAPDGRLRLTARTLAGLWRDARAAAAALAVQDQGRCLVAQTHAAHQLGCLLGALRPPRSHRP